MDCSDEANAAVRFAVLAMCSRQDAATAARRHLRRKAVEFDEADRDGDQEVDAEEFARFILPRVDSAGRAITAEVRKEWWALMDVDGDGFIRKDEFFLYALMSASRKSGTGIAAIFKGYDADGSGTLDEIEWERALEEMGFGDVATCMFEQHMDPKSRTISYLHLLKTVETRTNLPSMRTFLLTMASDSVRKVDTSGWRFGGNRPEDVRSGLASLLQRHGCRLSDLFAALDDDSSFSLTHEELKNAMWEIGFAGRPEVVGEIFDALDQDHSGHVSFEEFNAWVVGRTIIATADQRESAAAQMSLESRLQQSVDAGDASWSSARLRSELLNTLAEQGLRCLDLLRAWDKGNGGHAEGADNSISNKEFMLGMKRLCGGFSSDGCMWYTMAREGARASFAAMDKSGDGMISVTELCRWLDPQLKLMRQRTSKVGTELQARSARTQKDHRSVCVDGLAYSPTRLSTRLQHVRSFDPDPDFDKRKRTPLWRAKEPWDASRTRPTFQACSGEWSLGPDPSRPLVAAPLT